MKNDCIAESSEMFLLFLDYGNIMGSHISGIFFFFSDEGLSINGLTTSILVNPKISSVLDEQKMIASFQKLKLTLTF